MFSSKLLQSEIFFYVFRLDANSILKISDFGLSRDVQDKEYYKAENTSVELPVRWMSPESLTDWNFTTKSDVVGIFYSCEFCDNNTWENWHNVNTNNVSGEKMLDQKTKQPNRFLFLVERHLKHLKSTVLFGDLREVPFERKTLKASRKFSCSFHVWSMDLFYGARWCGKNDFCQKEEIISWHCYNFLLSGAVDPKTNLPQVLPWAIFCTEDEVVFGLCSPKKLELTVLCMIWSVANWELML